MARTFLIPPDLESLRIRYGSGLWGKCPSTSRRTKENEMTYVINASLKFRTKGRCSRHGQTSILLAYRAPALASSLVRGELPGNRRGPARLHLPHQRKRGAPQLFCHRPEQSR